MHHAWAKKSVSRGFSRIKLCFESGSNLLRWKAFRLTMWVEVEFFCRKRDNLWQIMYVAHDLMHQVQGLLVYQD